MHATNNCVLSFQTASPHPCGAASPSALAHARPPAQAISRTQRALQSLSMRNQPQPFSNPDCFFLLQWYASKAYTPQLLAQSTCRIARSQPPGSDWTSMSSSKRDHPAVDLVQTLSKASSVLDPQKTWEVGLACEVGKEVMLRSARALIEDAAGGPSCHRSHAMAHH